MKTTFHVVLVNRLKAFNDDPNQKAKLKHKIKIQIKNSGNLTKDAANFLTKMTDISHLIERVIKLFFNITG